MGKSQNSLLLLFLCLSALAHRSAAMVYWTAVVELSYDDSNNETVEKYCECGLYGRNSPVDKASGVVVLPRGDPKGCGPETDYSRNFSSSPWIALVKRGNCTFSEKINAAKRQGAAAVVVYNVDSSGNGTTQMSHSDADGIVAIMIGNIQGTEIACLVRNGTDVQMLIDVGRPNGPWMDTYWLYFLSIAFFVVTAASVAYFVFISANRLYSLGRHRRAEKKLKSEAKKAIGRLVVRTLKRGDELTTSDALCAVCIESYKAGEVVTVLTCDHIFHKACIEPWLLERRTCPMCKCDILKALGVEEDTKDMYSSPPAEVTVITVAGGDTMYEVPLNGSTGADPEQHQHRYDNRAFEADSEAARG
ncbi:RING finger protein 148 [Kryptolebias marmoratus]|uniref:RING finger protein 148-like n=1 Tax=Kryptolebias marmoratus TaxID=37003 RepID=A0A3Q3ASI8_KRYMA|nr:RING finger protein 148 [Kryptolebias marmoratus]